jgi:hypothetical protein
LTEVVSGVKSVSGIEEKRTAAGFRLSQLSTPSQNLKRQAIRKTPNPGPALIGLPTHHPPLNFAIDFL